MISEQAGCLKELTKEGYAEVSEEKQLKGAQKRRVYTLTPSGIEAYRVAREAWRTTIPCIYKAIEDVEIPSLESMHACPSERACKKQGNRRTYPCSGSIIS